MSGLAFAAKASSAPLSTRRAVSFRLVMIGAPPSAVISDA